MWALENNTPFASERAWVRDQDGAELWVVAIKGSFDFTTNGQVTLADQQHPVTLVPEYTDDDKTELLYDTDLPPYKKSTDVILNGTSYAPSGREERQWTANLRLASIDKTLRINGERTWLNGSLTDAKPVRSQPLSYRFAFGGINLSAHEQQAQFYAPNPIGQGYATERFSLNNTVAHHIDSLASPVQNWNDRPAPAAFSALPSHWQARSQFAGTYDQAWKAQRQPLLPEDFDPYFFQCAPPDQQVPGFLKGGEWVELTHLTPVKTLCFRLPKASFHLRTSFFNGYQQTHRAQLHTVIIEPDKHRIMMVWHSYLRCHHRVNQLKGTRIQVKERILTGSKDADAMVWAT